MAIQISDKFKTTGKLVSHREGAYPFQNFYLEPQGLVDEDLQPLERVSITIGKGFEKPDREPWADALADKYGGFENLVSHNVTVELSPNRQQPEHNGIKQFYVKTMAVTNQAIAPSPVQGSAPQAKSTPFSMESGAERGNATTNASTAVLEYYKINLEFPSDEWMAIWAEKTAYGRGSLMFFNNMGEKPLEMTPIPVSNDPIDIDDPFEVSEKSPLSEGQQLQKKIWEQEKEG